MTGRIPMEVLPMVESPTPPTNPFDPFVPTVAEPWDVPAAHLLRRAGFGPSPERLDRLLECPPGRSRP